MIVVVDQSFVQHCKRRVVKAMTTSKSSVAYPHVTSMAPTPAREGKLRMGGATVSRIIGA